MQESLPSSASLVKPERPATAWVLLSVGLAFGLYYWTHIGHLQDGWLEDIPVYRDGIQAWLTGGNPYTNAHDPLYFLYPPTFLWMVSFFNRLVPQGWGEGLFIAAVYGSVAGLPLLLGRFFFRQSGLGWLFLLLAFFAAPRFVGVQALATANIASLVYFLAFLTAIPGLRKNRWTLFYVVLALAALIKITFLVLLLLPLLAGYGQWVHSMACGAGVIAVNLAERLYIPELYGGFQWCLRQGIVAQQHFGFGPFGIVARIGHKNHTGAGTAAYITGVAFAGLMVGAMFLMRSRLERRQYFRPQKDGAKTNFSRGLSSNPVWMAMVVMTVVVVSPRLMQYDMDVALFAGFTLWLAVLRIKRPLLLLAGLLLPSLAVPFVVTNPHLNGMYDTATVLMVFLLSYRKLWKESAGNLRGAAENESILLPTTLQELSGA